MYKYKITFNKTKNTWEVKDCKAPYEVLFSSQDKNIAEQKCKELNEQASR